MNRIISIESYTSFYGVHVIGITAQERKAIAEAFKVWGESNQVRSKTYPELIQSATVADIQHKVCFSKADLKEIAEEVVEDAIAALTATVPSTNVYSCQYVYNTADSSVTIKICVDSPGLDWELLDLDLETFTKSMGVNFGKLPANQFQIYLNPLQTLRIEEIGSGLCKLMEGKGLVKVRLRGRSLREQFDALTDK